MHTSSPIYLAGVARPGPSLRDNLAVHAMARILLHGRIRNIQTSWVKLGVAGAQQLLRAGVNDLGGTLMDESISRAAGASHGQEMAPDTMEDLIRSLGRTPRQRTTLYEDAPEEQVRRSFGAEELAEVLNAPVREAGLKAPPRKSFTPAEATTSAISRVC